MLDGSLPADPRQAAAAIDGLMARMQATITAMPAHTQSEIARLLALLAMPPGRIALAGLSSGWAETSVAELQGALQSMRQSSLMLRRQAYHALRDLTHAAFFADTATWPLLRYPGPRDLS